MLNPDRFRCDERLQLGQVGRLVEKFGAAHYVLNFEQVDLLHAGELGSLVAAHNYLQEVGGQMTLVNVSPLVLEILQITNLDRLFEIHIAESRELEQVA